MTHRSAHRIARRVAVIGAGPAGLATAKCLLDEGLEPTILDKSEQLGGLWAPRPAGGTYRSTRLQTSRYTSGFSDFPIGQEHGDFPDAGALHRYFHAYAERFGLLARMRPRTEVLALETAEGGWDVHLADARGSRRERFDAVAVCTGVLRIPKQPRGVGEDQFRGTLLHASAYDEPSLFAGRRVCVVGSGVSGMDIATDAAPVAREVIWSMRSRRWIIPRVWGFVPGDIQITPASSLLGARLTREQTLSRWRRIMPDFMAAYEQSGLLPKGEPGELGFVVNEHITGLVAAGRVRVAPAFSHLTEREVVFADGSRAPADVVVLATGYDLTALPALHPALRAAEEGPRLYEHVFHPDLPGLAVIGMFATALNTFPTMELQARWFGRVLTGNAALPSPAEMRAALDREGARRKAAIPFEGCRNIVVNSPIYDVSLAERIGAWPDPESDFDGYWELLRAPILPARFRLLGPHRWESARAVVDDHSRKAFLAPPGPEEEELRAHLRAQLDQRRAAKPRRPAPRAPRAPAAPLREELRWSLPEALSFYQTIWRDAPLPASPARGRGGALLLSFRPELERPLQAEGIEAQARLVAGVDFEEMAPRCFRVDPGNAAHLEQLVGALRDRGALPGDLVLDADPPQQHEATERYWPTWIAPAFGQTLLPALRLVRALLGGLPEGGLRLLALSSRGPDLYGVLHDAFNGLGRSVEGEAPGLRCKTVCRERLPARIEDLLTLARAELDAWSSGPEVAYHGERRQVRALAWLKPPTLPASGPPSPFGPEPVVWITGGLGGLGLLVARHFATRHRARLVLSGRSALREAQKAQLVELERRGAEVLALQADVTKLEDLRRAMEAIEARFGQLHAVIHAAGVLEDGFLRDRDEASLLRIMAPKIRGAVLLDEVTRDQPLERFVVFSSFSGVKGNPGQAAYAAANRFLDAFAARREAQSAAGQRRGKSLSLAWPYWADGGMRMPERTIELMRRFTGLSPMTEEQGMAALDLALAFPTREPLIPLAGAEEQVRAWLDPAGGVLPWAEDAGSPEAPPAAPVPSTASAHASVPSVPPAAAPSAKTASPSAGGSPDQLRARLGVALVSEVSDLLKLAPGEIDLRAPISDYGFDSLTLAELGRRIANRFPFAEVSPASFLENPSLERLASHLASRHPEAFEQALAPARRLPPAAVSNSGPAAAPRIPVPAALAPALAPSAPAGALPARAALQGAALGLRGSGAHPSGEQRIAVIGIGGRFPGAADPRALWAHLMAGRSLIQEVPPQRWDWRALDGDPMTRPDRTDCRWGAFLEDVDAFDERFFRITPREAVAMDPQQRLLLEAAWSTVEDAGYRASRLAGQRVGVFVGLSRVEYGTLLALTSQGVSGHSNTGNAAAMLVNRVSAHFDWIGPSEAVDTACSSSAHALHRAVRALQAGDCAMALAGGVNVVLSPASFITNRKLGLLTSEDRVRSFDREARGHLFGEGVATLLLKPLDRALEDGDHVYGLILSSATNHGGKSTSLTAPNPERQADLIVDVWTRAGIDPATVDWIEGQGTATPLGDLAELHAYDRALRRLLPEHRAPGPILGSYKGNLGHLEAASGLVAVIKVLLAMRYAQIPATLHFQAFSEHYRPEGPRLRVLTQPAPWEKRQEGDGKPRRRAAVHNFGYGGANAHVLLEEPPPAPPAPDLGRPELVVLSAREEKDLRARGEQLRGLLANAWMESAPMLGDLAQTLRIGREPMPARLAIVAESLEDLDQRLAAWLAGTPDPGTTWQGVVEAGAEPGLRAFFQRDSVGRAALRELVEQRQWARLAPLWVEGVDPDWPEGAGFGRRVPLPAYPFQRRSHWGLRPLTSLGGMAGAAGEHPLLDRVVVRRGGLAFLTWLSGQQPWVHDHQVQGRALLPASAIVEMLRAAADLAGEGGAAALGDIVWTRPIEVEAAGRALEVRVIPSAAGAELELRCDGADTVFARGRAQYGVTPEAPASFDPASLRRSLRPVPEVPEGFYRAMAARGLVYGPSLQVIHEIHAGPGEALARLRLPEDAVDQSFVFHPALLDGALQAVAAVGLGDGALLPYALGALERFGPMEREMLVRVRRIEPAEGAGEARLVLVDVDLTDLEGRPRACLRRVGLLRLEPAQGEPRRAEGADAHLPAALSTDRAVAWLQRLVAGATGLEAPAIDPRMPLDQYGIDSVMVMDLTGKLEAHLGELPRTLLLEYPRLDALAEYLGRERSSALAAVLDTGGTAPGSAAGASGADGLDRASGDNGAQERHGARAGRVLVPVHLPARARANGRSSFWVHGLPGEAGWATRFAQHLAPSWPERSIYAIQARGFDGLAPPHTRVEDMAEDYIEALRAVQPRGPYVLGGYSLGGAIAFEMAHQLRAQREEVSHLVLLDTYAPDSEELRPLEPFMDDSFLLLIMGNWLGRLWSSRHTLRREDLAGRSREERIVRVADHLQRHGTPTLSPAALEGYLATLDRLCQANASAATLYRPRPYEAPLSVTLFQCRQGFIGDTAAFGLPPLPPLELVDGHGWSRHIRSAIHVHHLDCSHFELAAEPWVAQVAASLSGLS